LFSHINKQTTYENPYMHQQQQQQNQLNSHVNQQDYQEQLAQMKTFKPATSSSLLELNNQVNTNSPLSTTNVNMNQQQQQQQQQNKQRNTRNIYFTQNPNELKGEFIKTSLLKTPHGFGFTIIGANETSEDFLQIKYIVPDGAAKRDNRLRQGDVLVYVNNECVLGYTHQDVVEIFQSIPVGNFVELTVCRGYPLSIDPNDPNIEIMPLAAINNPNNLANYQQHQQQQLQNSNTITTTTTQHTSTSMSTLIAPLAAVDELTASTLVISKDTSDASPIHHHYQQQQPLSSPTLDSTNLITNGGAIASPNDEYYCEEYEEMYAPIVKGFKGFGFTIADDSHMNHQKVKQILDKERCCNLNENDILLEINGVDLKNLNHNQVVDVLKECMVGQETIIRLKRRKYEITLPQAPYNSSLLLASATIPPPNNFMSNNTFNGNETNNIHMNNNNNNSGKFKI
jgi:C-terminal processing protease CtpA/Prc